MKYEWKSTCLCGKKISLDQDNGFLACCERHYYLTPDFFVHCIINGSQEHRVGGCILTGDTQ